MSNMNERSSRFAIKASVRGLAAVALLPLLLDGTVIAAAPPAPAAAAPEVASSDDKDWAPPGGRIGYVLWDEVSWGLRETPDKQECPHGFNIGPREQFSEEFPKDGKKRTLAETQLKREAAIWDPDTTPDEFPFYEATGKYAIGVNLDGKDTPEDFESDDGRKGIDNQLFRVVGCIRNYRKEGELGIITTKWRAQKPFNRVTFELSGVDSLKNDPDVTVSYYRTLDTLLAGPTGNYLPGGSQRIDERWGKRFIISAKGHIVDGVLETEPFKEIQVPEDGMGDPAINIFRSAQLRLKLTPKSAEGVLAGFIDVEQWYYAMNTSWATHHAAYGQASAASIYKALRRLADGYPDPETGQNTAISGAMDMRLTQVYVIHQEEDSAAAAQ
ncbi:hypothetical protein [Solimonas marina]|uniref:Uncharacterized protein n=1 Tax=Solimonas marina TaxID=2714601 RepID=A0A970B668_9GAMM|nr:hypothetical protein [Solimonas marina]NKF22325.1 hypothetical protein [Solimonas marina]